MNVKDVKLSPEQWVALLQKYGVPASSLTGKGAPCPICGGNDRFTYDNNRGRGDWVCRKCNDGDRKAGDGFELICKVGGNDLPRVDDRTRRRPSRRCTT